MTSSRSERLANGDQLAVAVFRLTHCFHWKAQGWGWGSGILRRPSLHSALEKGRYPSLEPCGCSERTRNKNRFRRVGTVMI